jgi:hypothetical protein
LYGSAAVTSAGSRGTQPIRGARGRGGKRYRAHRGYGFDDARRYRQTLD